MCFLLLFSALVKTDQSGPLVNTSDDALKLIKKDLGGGLLFVRTNQRI